MAGVQERVASELDSLGLLVHPGCPTPPRELEEGDLPALRYLRCCVKEAMRMFPVVTLMGRSVGCGRGGGEAWGTLIHTTLCEGSVHQLG